jgi:hypothetical protein
MNVNYFMSFDEFKGLVNRTDPQYEYYVADCAVTQSN